MTVEWGELPPSRKKPNRVTGAVEQLKTRPGQWAMVETNNAPARIYAFKLAGCEVTSRKRADGRFDIWARWPE